MPIMHILMKPASGLCNMRCGYCFYTDEMEKREQGSYGIMTPETLENVIRESLSFAEGECTIAYQGGEPTLAGLDFFRRSIELQEKYNVNKVQIHNALQTNGYLLDEEWCEFFREHHFLVGLSVDGIKSTHDEYRRDASGNGTYFRILESAERLKRHQVDFNILTVVNGRTAPKIRKIYEQYRKLGFGFQQYIACLDPMGEVPGKRDYSLTPAAYGQFLMDLFELWNIDLENGKQPYIRQFENWVAILCGQMPESCEQMGVCNIQNVVEADGGVYPCDFYVIDKYCIGNLNHDSFQVIYDNRRKSGFLESSRNHSKACLECAYFNICRGGCRRHRENPSGIFEAGEQEEDRMNYFCQGYKMFFDKYYDRLCEIARFCMRRR